VLEIRENVIMKDIVHGVLKFKESSFPERKQLFADLANQQNPDILFITCSDSRIDPSLLTQTNPGELFICRNAGNVVPPHSDATGGMTASIEYAVAVLGVRHIIICGHTDCGAMKGAIYPDSVSALPHVKEWLGHCRAAVEVVKEKTECSSLDHAHLDDVIEENVLLQLNHLRTHPAVAGKIATGKVGVHGWVYSIEHGTIRCYDEKNKAFADVRETYADLLDEGDQKTA
jgi:carbonic anhydrase